MATKLNKSLVGGLTVVGMLIMGVVGFMLIYKLPGADPQQFVDEAVKCEKRGDWKAAGENYMRAFSFDRRTRVGGNPEWLSKAASCLFELGDIGGVRELTKRARLLDSMHKPSAELLTKTEFELAKAYPMASQWSNVRDAAERLLKIDANSTLAQHSLGIAWLSLSDENSTFKAKGEEALRKTLQLDPTNTDAATTLADYLYGEQRATDADEVVSASLQRCVSAGDKEAQAKLQVWRGQRLLSQGKIDDANAAFKAAEDLKPNLPDSHYALATFYLVKGKDFFKQAEEELIKAKKVDSKFVPAYLRLASLYVSMGRREDEARILREGIENVPKGVGFRFIQSNQLRILMMKDLLKSALVRAAQGGAAATQKADRFAEAESWLKRAEEEVGPDPVLVKLMRAFLWREQGKLIEATREAEAAEKVIGRGRNIEVAVLLSECYSASNQVGAAVDKLREVIAIAPFNANAYVVLGRMLQRQGEYQQALRVIQPDGPPALRAAIDANPDAVQLAIECYAALKQTDKIDALRKKLATTTTGDRVRDAQIAMMSDRRDEAEAILRGVVKEEPKNISATALLVQMLYQKKDEAGAREVVDAALKTNPDNRSLRAMAISLDPAQDPKVRDQKFVEFLNEDPDPLMRELRKYFFFTERNDLVEAKKALDAAEKLNPDSPVVVDQQFRMAIRREDWAAAEKYCDVDSKLNTDGTRGRMMRGRLASAREDHVKAIEYFKEGLQAYPSNSVGWTFLAASYLSLGQRSEARETLERALRLNPTNGFANRFLGQMYLEDGDKKNARKYLEAAAKTLPDDPLVRGQLQIFKEEDDPQSGITAREEIRKAEPDNIQNLLTLARLYAKVKQPDKADECLKQLLAGKKDNIRLVAEVAVIYGKELQRPGDGETVLLDLLKQTQQKEQKSQVAQLLARYYQDMEQLDRAERYYLMAANLNPTALTAAGVAEFYSSTNRHRDGLDWFDKARALVKDDKSKLTGVRRRIIQLAILVRDRKRAEKEIDAYINDYPDDDQGRLLRGLFFLQSGDISEAEKAFQQQLERKPDNAMALWQLGQVHLLRNRWQLAIDELARAKAFNPTGFNYEHRIAYARALFGAARFEEGADELKSILKEDPDAQNVAAVLVEEYLRSQPPRLADAEGVVLGFIRRLPDDARWPALLGRIRTLAGDCDKAIEAYRQSVIVSKFATSPVLKLLDSYEACKRVDEVIDFVTKILPPARRTRLPAAEAALAQALARKGEVKAAQERFAAALNLARDDFDAYRIIAAKMLDSLGAEKSLESAKAQVDATGGSLESLKILMHLHFVSKQYAEAQQVGDRIVTNADRDDDMLFGLIGQAIILTSLERYGDAAKRYEDALKLDPGSAMALNNLAYLLTDKLGRAAEAVPYAERALEGAPGDANTLDTYGWALALANRLPDAEGALLRALDADPDNTPVQYHLGVVYQKQGNLADARTRFERAAKIAERTGDPGAQEYGALAQKALKDMAQSP